MTNTAKPKITLAEGLGAVAGGVAVVEIELDRLRKRVEAVEKRLDAAAPAIEQGWQRVKIGDQP